MRAAILNGYQKNGGTLAVCDIPVPGIEDNEVLVKVKAAGVNPLDNMIIRGEVKLIVPYKFPLIMGNEFCGVVDKVGKAVRNFAVGNRVYGRMPLKKISLSLIKSEPLSLRFRAFFLSSEQFSCFQNSSVVIRVNSLRYSAVSIRLNRSFFTLYS